MGKEPLLQLENLKVDFFLRSGKETAIHGLDLQLERGKTLGLVGESGCGKSTLARSILGLESLDHGRITLENSPISFHNETKKDVRSKIQIVFQDPFSSFNPRHRIERIISEPLNLSNKKTTKEIWLEWGKVNPHFPKHLQTGIVKNMDATLHGRGFPSLQELLLTGGLYPGPGSLSWPG